MLLLAVLGIAWGNTELWEDNKYSKVVVEEDWLKLRGGIALDLIDELDVERRVYKYILIIRICV